MKLWQVLQIVNPENHQRKERVFRYVALGETVAAAIARVKEDNERSDRLDKWEAYPIEGGVFGIGVYFREVKK